MYKKESIKILYAQERNNKEKLTLKIYMCVYVSCKLVLLSLSWAKQAFNLPHPHLDYSCFNSPWNFILTVNHYFLILYSQYLLTSTNILSLSPSLSFLASLIFQLGWFWFFLKKKSLDIYFNVGFLVVIALSFYLKILYLYSWIFHWINNSRLARDFFPTLHY